VILLHATGFAWAEFLLSLSQPRSFLGLILAFIPRDQPDK